MAFFNEIGKKISQTSQGVVQKTKDTAETMKLNSAISEEEKRINGIYYDLGKAYYEHHAENPEDLFASMVAGIKDANAKIKDYKEQIVRLKGYMPCPGCGKDVLTTAAFCSSCGCKIEPPVQRAEASAKRFCTVCGNSLAADAVFCTGCGTRVAGPVQVETAPIEPEIPAVPMAEVAPAEPEIPAVPVVETAPAEPETRKCPVCQGNVPADYVFCTHCGASMAQNLLTEVASEAQAEPELDKTVAFISAETAVEVPVEVEATRCPDCGMVVADDASFCTNCGSPLKAAPVFSAVKKCTNCGAQLEDDAMFCTQCGTKIAQ